jgi:hypothetical protein
MPRAGSRLPPGLTRFSLKGRLQGIHFCGKRAMRPWLLIVAFAFSIGAAMAEDLPPAVQKAIAENKRDCKTVAVEKDFVTRRDINGDGRPDFVLNYESLICNGDRRWFCGSLGCTTQVFASLPNGTYAKVLDGIFKRIEFREVQGRPAIVVGFPGFACGKDPTEICEVVKSWNGSSFVDMPAPATSRTAGIKNAKSLGPIRAVLAEVITMYGKGQMGPFASDPVMRRHFTAQFISVWDRAIARSDSIIDADPFTGQGVNSVNLQGVDIIAETPNSATVGMDLGGTNLDNSPFSGGARLFMRREGPNWKIDDIAGPENGTTWRGYIEKALAK